MGIEIQVNSLEDMCALMCDNVIPKRGEIITNKEAIEILETEKSEYINSSGKNNTNEDRTN